MWRFKSGANSSCLLTLLSCFYVPPFLHQEMIVPNNVIDLPPPSPPKPKTIVLPPSWKVARDPEGKIYYYHIATRSAHTLSLSLLLSSRNVVTFYFSRYNEEQFLIFNGGGPRGPNRSRDTYNQKYTCVCVGVCGCWVEKMCQCYIVYASEKLGNQPEQN